MKDFIITKSKAILKNIGILLIYLLIWQLVYSLVQREVYLPSPGQVFMRLGELIGEKSFWQAVAMSMYRVVWGLFLATFLGLVFGALAGWSKFCYSLMHPLVVAIKSTPAISFIIIALIWFSSSNAPIFICVLMCFPIIWTNILTGIQSVDQKLLEMAKVYRVKKWDIMQKIYFPTILPYFTAAIITALGMGWKVSVAAEVLSHPRHAVGSHLYTAKVYLDSSSLFAWTIVVITLSLILEKVLSYCLNKFKERGNKHAEPSS